MKRILAITITLFSFALAESRAGLSSSGNYVDFDTTSDNVVERLFFVEIAENKSNFILIDYILDRVEVATLSLSDNAGSGITNHGRGVSIQSFNNQQSVRLTLAGQTRNVPFLRPADSGKQLTYTGTVFLGNGSEALVTRLTFVEERFIMFWISESGLINGGFGELQNGQAQLSVVNNLWVEFPFSPQDGWASGRATFKGTAVNAFDFLLVQRAAPSMINISTRGWIGEGQRLIAGTVVADGPKRLLIRAVGPTLSGFGVDSAHADPRITVFQGQSEVASNDDWSGSDISDSASFVGAFALSEGSKDAAMVLTLSQGAYTIVVEGDGDLGEAIVEVYEIR